MFVRKSQSNKKTATLMEERESPEKVVKWEFTVCGLVYDFDLFEPLDGAFRGF